MEKISNSEDEDIFKEPLPAFMDQSDLPDRPKSPRTRSVPDLRRALTVNEQ